MEQGAAEPEVALAMVVRDKGLGGEMDRCEMVELDTPDD